MRVIAVSLVVWVGCGTPDPAPPLAARPVRIDKLGTGEIDVIVEGQKYATLSAERLRAGVRLDELVDDHPYLGWSAITLYGDSLGPVTWLDPVTNYAGRVPLAFLDGDRGAIAMVDPSHPDERDVSSHQDGIDEIHIEFGKRLRTPLEQLAAGCVPEPRGELATTPPAPKKWRGPSHQFNIPMHWKNRLAIDLSGGKPGAHAGTLEVSAVEWTEDCHYELYWLADRKGRRAVVARLAPDAQQCVDSIYEFVCAGSALNMWGYYAMNNEYVELGTLSPVP